MAFMEWSDDLKVGISEIDGQHQRLIDLANKLQASFETGAPPAQLGSQLNQLVDLSLLHFATEEKYFSEYRYPKATAHIEEHKHFAVETQQLQANLLKTGKAPDIEVLGFLEKWLRSHIRGGDLDFAVWAKQHGLTS
jgi:hemerythrin